MTIKHETTRATGGLGEQHLVRSGPERNNVVNVFEGKAAALSFRRFSSHA